MKLKAFAYEKIMIEKTHFTLKYATAILLAPNRIPISAKLASFDMFEVIPRFQLFRKKIKKTKEVTVSTYKLQDSY